MDTMRLLDEESEEELMGFDDLEHGGVPEEDDDDLLRVG